MIILANIFMWIGIIFTVISYAFLIKEYISNKEYNLKETLLLASGPIGLIILGILTIVNYDDGL
jgi:predicted transporter